MKGLLLKDLYTMLKYCRTYLIVSAIFIILSPFANENLFVLYYPCMLAALAPVNLQSYDERSGWEAFAQTLPYTKAQLVSSKYLTGLVFQLAIVIPVGILKALFWDASLASYLAIMASLLIMVLLSSALPLPFIFKYGVEKGRMVQYLLILLICGGGAALTTLNLSGSIPSVRLPEGLWLLGILAAMALFALSWYLSIVFYRKREIQ